MRTSVLMEVMAVTLTQFAKIPRLHISAHVKLGLKGTVNIVKVGVLLS